MSQKRFTNVTLVGIIVAVIVSLAGYFSFRQKSVVDQGGLPVQPSGTVTSDNKSTARGPLDTAWAVLTVLSVKDEIAYVQIEEIRNYNRHPEATYPELKTGDKINTRVYDMAFSDNGRTDALMQRAEELNTPVPSPKPEVGRKYLADMSYCLTDYFDGLSCGYQGWSSVLYPF